MPGLNAWLKARFNLIIATTEKELCEIDQVKLFKLLALLLCSIFMQSNLKAFFVK